MKALAATLLAVCGCVGYHVELGPPFQPVTPPPGQAVVYLYRPAKLTGWMRPVHVVIDGQERIVMVEGYAVMLVAPGHHEVVAYSTGTAQNYVTIGFGGGAWAGASAFDAAPGEAVYLRLAASLGSTSIRVMSEADGRAQSEQLRLSAGGAPR